MGMHRDYYDRTWDDSNAHVLVDENPRTIGFDVPGSRMNDVESAEARLDLLAEYAAELKDSGTRDTFQTGAVRDGQTGKGRFDLLPYHGLERVAQHFERGAMKYAERNWEMGIPTHRFADSAMRHLAKAVAGETDEDHLAAAAWNILCLIQTEQWIAMGILPTELNTRKWPRISGNPLP